MMSIKEQLGDELIEARQRLADSEALVDRLRSNILALFRRGAAVGKQCKYCQAPIYYFIHRDSQKTGVYDPDGTSHWNTCPRAEEARKAIAAARKP